MPAKMSKCNSNCYFNSEVMVKLYFLRQLDVYFSSQETAEVTLLYILVCFSKVKAIALAILFGYKMILQIVALIFAFSIRKVKIKGLNDAKYIGAAVYVTSIVSAIGIVSIYTLQDYVNIFSTIMSIGIFIGTTSILGLVMLPPVSVIVQR